MDVLSQLDLAFCVDVTTSMTSLIQAARERMLDVLAALSERVGGSLRFALVCYRDHARREKPVEVHPLTDDRAATRQALERLAVVSQAQNTDAAEAVFAGLVACLRELTWRPQALRMILLIGDAPPHACGAVGNAYSDRFPDKDPSGETLMSMSAAVEGTGVTLHALGMLPSPIPCYDGLLEKTFSWLATTTGGTYRTARSARDALALVEVIGQRLAGQFDLDRRVWAELQDGAGVADVEAKVRASPYEIHASLERLRKRGLVQ